MNKIHNTNITGNKSTSSHNNQKNSTLNQFHLQQIQLNQKRGKQILKRKLQLIRLWSSIFFSSNHLCIMDFMIAKANLRQKIYQDQLSRFSNYDNVIAEFKQGFIVIDGTQKKTYDINISMIQILPLMIEKIKNTIKSDKQLYKLNVEKQKICIKCGKSKQIALIQSGFRCQCGYAQFKQIKHDYQKQKRLTKVQQLIDIIIAHKQEIQKMQEQLQRAKIIQQDNQKKNNVRKVSNYKQFINALGRKYQIQKPKNIHLEDQIAFKEFINREMAPLNQFKRVNQFLELRQKRKIKKPN